MKEEKAIMEGAKEDQKSGCKYLNLFFLLEFLILFKLIYAFLIFFNLVYLTKFCRKSLKGQLEKGIYG